MTNVYVVVQVEVKPGDYSLRESCPLSVHLSVEEADEAIDQYEVQLALSKDRRRANFISFFMEEFELGKIWEGPV